MLVVLRQMTFEVNLIASGRSYLDCLDANAKGKGSCFTAGADVSDAMPRRRAIHEPQDIGIECQCPRRKPLLKPLLRVEAPRKRIPSFRRASKAIHVQLLSHCGAL